MKRFYKPAIRLAFLWGILSALFPFVATATPVIFINQVGFDSQGPKMAILQTDAALSGSPSFCVVEANSGQTAFTFTLGIPQQISDWAPGKWFYRLEFSHFTKPGTYTLNLRVDGIGYRSEKFVVGGSEPLRSMVGAIIHYYNQQRANTPGELAADRHLQLFGSEEKVDLQGGWCDASGDVSKYFSHLAYANFMSPQQIPLVTWSMASADENISSLLQTWGLKDSLENEALWGADYMMRALSPEDYFYMIVFSYFNKDPNARRVVGLHANSVTTNEYQCAFREGGGMAIAALARISRWKKNGAFTSAQYLDAARRAFAHLVINNTRYDDDGKENIIDDYCALMAATELWIATDSGFYQDQARKRAQNLAARMTAGGYFVADDGYRPFWHASDAGLPVVALARYAGKEQNPLLRQLALNTIKKALDYNVIVTDEVSNPFNYARQTFIYKDSVRNGFFIPHENETGWWWQGENARLGSLATCFMYKFGSKNVPYMSSNFAHGSEMGGISNGITGRDGNGDGSGIDFKEKAAGEEWRWTEQWLPHAAWFLQALAATAADH